MELLSSEANEEHFTSLGLEHCSRIATMSDLVDQEFNENFETLKHHVTAPEQSRRDFEELAARYAHKHDTTGSHGDDGKERVLRSSDAEGGKHQYTFDSYVS